VAREGAQAWLANDFVAHSVFPINPSNAAQFQDIGATLYFVNVPLPALTDSLADFLGAPRRKVLPLPRSRRDRSRRRDAVRGRREKRARLRLRRRHGRYVLRLPQWSRRDQEPTAPAIRLELMKGRATTVFANIIASPTSE
jgi:hypothetical protein